MRRLIKAFSILLAPSAKRFERALSQPRVAQKDLQQALFDQLIRSDYGQSLAIRSIEDWHKIPVVSYEELRPWIAANKSLTPETVLFYETTSGSSGAAKQIPYTRALRTSFNTLFCIWAYDLIRNGPGFKTGKIYMCISPKLLAPGEASAGLQDDSEYLDRWLRWLLKPFLVSPADAHRPQTPDVFQASLCKTLLLTEDLEIISIWSPSFLSIQLDYIQTHRRSLQESLRGQLSSQRSALLDDDPISWEALWPNLKLISCWDSAISADQSHHLASYFPNTLIQGKGLLATEAPMTVPLIAANGCVPLVNDVFFEFEDDTGQIHALHELQIGQSYEVIISQKGGLYRYRMCDRVQVTLYYNATPCLKFLGRSTTSDLVGEKLTLEFVTQIMQQLDLSATAFKCLVPSLSPQPRYSLLIDRVLPTTDQLAKKLDQQLAQNVHYRQARLLGQLQPAQVCAAPEILQRLMQYHYRQGRRLGDVKYPYLLTQPIHSLADIFAADGSIV